MQIDCYGFEASSQWFRRKSLDVYLMKEHEGVAYLCFGDQAVRPIHRIDKDLVGTDPDLVGTGPEKADLVGTGPEKACCF